MRVEIFKTKKLHLGFSFTDEIAKVKSKTGYFKKHKQLDWTDSLLPNFDRDFDTPFLVSGWRITFLYIFCLILFFLIFIRTFHLQIIIGSQNRTLADGNRIQIKIIHAQRGVIFDRNSQILAANSPAFRLIDKNTKRARLITREQALELEVKEDVSSDNLEVDNVRTYPMGEKLAHIVGYVGEISDKQLKQPEYKNYHLGDRIGQGGIEAQYESILRGVDGGEIVEVDSSGKKVRTLRRNPPISGQNITLAIDTSLQDKVYESLKQALSKVDSCCGAAIAMDPNNGQILALVSLPSYDPNIFSKVYDEGVISQIFSQTEAPILNRAIAGTYPPGSTFKIVSSLAALSEGYSADTTIIDKGVMYIGDFKFTNWYFNQYGKVEGAVDLLKALQRSNDTYFYEVGRRVGEEKLIKWAKKLKLGDRLDIDLPGEATGLIPDNEWKRKTFGVGWYPGDTLHMAIGQGFVLTTPLQILGATSFIAGEGTLYKPQLVISGFKPKVLVSNIVSKDKVEVVKKGLELVPKPGGTAWPFFTFPIPTAGKTGTAEYGNPKGKTHAWYTSYAPANNPKISLTVLVEGGGEGSSVAAPVAKEIFRWYFSEDKNKLIQDIDTQATDSGKSLGE